MKTLDTGKALITLTQEAYISDCGKYYFASGEYEDNGQNFTCRVRWNVKENYDESDQADACNWVDFCVEELGVK